MKTERYIISLFGIDSRYYTDEYLSHIWEECANKEFYRSSKYITGLIDRRSLVCGEVRGCKLTEYDHVITIVRNPVEIETQEIFVESLKNILRDIRNILNHPSMTISIQDMEYYYFV